MNCACLGMPASQPLVFGFVLLFLFFFFPPIERFKTAYKKNRSNCIKPAIPIKTHQLPLNQMFESVVELICPELNISIKSVCLGLQSQLLLNTPSFLSIRSSYHCCNLLSSSMSLVLLHSYSCDFPCLIDQFHIVL